MKAHGVSESCGTHVEASTEEAFMNLPSGHGDKINPGLPVTHSYPWRQENT